MKNGGLLMRDRFVTVTYEPEFEDLPEAFCGFKAVFLSDLHGKTFGPDNADLINGVLSALPDAVFIGGDMAVVKPRKKPDFSALEALLRGLYGKVPVYYAEGNHETRMTEEADRYPGWREAWESLLTKYGVRLLSNESVRLSPKAENRPDGAEDGAETTAAGAVFLSGLTLPKSAYPKFRKARLPKGDFREKFGERKGFTILLMHSPAHFAEAVSYGADLTLSGHYHGGTVRIGKTGLMTPDFVFLEKHARGAFEREGKKLIVSAGLGTHSVNLRVNDPPELIKIVLRRKDDGTGGI